jgi:hypothetical protein
MVERGLSSMEPRYYISQLELELHKAYGPGYAGSQWELLVNALKALENKS